MKTDFRIIIVDDELAARKVISNLLRSNHPEVLIDGVAEGVNEAEQLIREKNPDLLFLDVEMEDGTGFDLLDRFPTLDFNVIFTTAYDEFAIRAFRYNAVDYLLKPIDPDELAVAIEKVKHQRNQEVFQSQIAQLVESATNKIFDRITLQTSKGYVFTKTSDITRIESYGNYTFVFLADGERCLVLRNLKDFEEILPHPDFFRLHQSHIVNTAFVKKILKEDGGCAIMKDGTRIPIARRKKEAFLEILNT